MDFYTIAVKHNGPLNAALCHIGDATHRLVDAYIVTASLLPMQFTQAVTIGFYAISMKYNESLDATSASPNATV
eukprot:scaffold15252_cov160-Skeletonema_menzelii.AAC.1